MVSQPKGLGRSPPTFPELPNGLPEILRLFRAKRVGQSQDVLALLTPFGLAFQKPVDYLGQKARKSLFPSTGCESQKRAAMLGLHFNRRAHALKHNRYAHDKENGNASEIECCQARSQQVSKASGATVVLYMQQLCYMLKL